MTSNNILVPIDFSDQSFNALEKSFDLARNTDSAITLINVDEGIEIDANAKIQKLAQEFSKLSGIKINTIIVKGNIYRQIISTAKKLDSKFIVMGFNSSKGINNIGHNVYRVLRHSPCPLITIKGKRQKNDYRNVLLPLDLTKQTREKVKNAIAFSKIFHSTIHVVSVRLHKEKNYDNKLTSYANQVKAHIKKEGLACTMKTLEGDAIAQLVVGYAAEINADLIIIMSQQNLNIKELFVGTNSQKIVQLSEIPVLTIRPIRRKAVARY